MTEWILDGKAPDVFAYGYYPNRFLRACEVLGILERIRKITTEEEDLFALSPLDKGRFAQWQNSFQFVSALGRSGRRRNDLSESR
jgi:hypothetical protein